MKLLQYQAVKDKIVHLRNQDVILDFVVAELYGVETKRVNEAVKNNPDKFPDGYIFPLNDEEWHSLRSKFSTLKPTGRGEHTKYVPKAFTEKGLYMLATILKSPQATETTIAIIEAFASRRLPNCESYPAQLGNCPPVRTNTRKSRSCKRAVRLWLICLERICVPVRRKRKSNLILPY